MRLVSPNRSPGALDELDRILFAASAPRDAGHASGTLDAAQQLLARNPSLASASIYAAAILGNEAAVRHFIDRDPASVTNPGGLYGWDALTYLCFSRYLRLEQHRSQDFVQTAAALLDAGASPNTGWYEQNDAPGGEPIFESALYGAAGIAHDPELTRILLERGADPNDGETEYHTPESYDNRALKVLLESGRVNERSKAIMLVRKADVHDFDGLRIVLEHGANPNFIPPFGNTALQHTILRDNSLDAVALLLDYGADPASRNRKDNRSSFEMAARRGRGDVLRLFAERGFVHDLTGVERLIAACATAGSPGLASTVSSPAPASPVTASMPREDPALVSDLIAQGGTLLAEFAGNGNVAGVRCLLDLGVSPSVMYAGDPYFEIPAGSTALHVASWRAQHSAVRELLARGTPVDARDGRGHTALRLAIRACVNSYWMARRSPESIAALLPAGASAADVALPTGYDAADDLLRAFA